MDETYETGCSYLAVEFLEEGRLQLASTVVIGMVALEYLVHTFEEKRPEAVKRPVVFHIRSHMSCVVVIGSDNRGTIQLMTDHAVSTA